MKFLVVNLFLLMSTLLFSQKYIDMTEKLSNIDGNLAIDGNVLKLKLKTREEIIITGRNLHLKNNCGFVFNNLILELSGSIIIDEGATVYPKIIDSYIFCKSSENLQSNRIIEGTRFNDIVENVYP